MVLGGLRTVTLAALLMTVGFAPMTASGETCVSPGVVNVCVDDPGHKDAGEASSIDGDVSATANGGIVPGLGSAEFVADYTVSHTGLQQGEEVLFFGELEVLDGEGDLVGRDTVFLELVPGDGEETGELRVEVPAVDAVVDGGSVQVSARADLNHADGTTRLGFAQSASPITMVVAPPSDVAERTQVAETVEAGTFEAGPAGAFADAVDGSLLVAQGTSMRFEATGELSSSSLSGVDSFSQNARASLRMVIDGELHFAIATPISESCFSTDGTCSTDAQSVPTELSIVVPGDLLDPRSEIDVRVDARWFLSADGFDSTSATDHGQNVLYAAGP